MSPMRLFSVSTIKPGTIYPLQSPRLTESAPLSPWSSSTDPTETLSWSIPEFARCAQNPIQRKSLLLFKWTDKGIVPPLVLLTPWWSEWGEPGSPRHRMTLKAAAELVNYLITNLKITRISLKFDDMGYENEVENQSTLQYSLLREKVWDLLNADSKVLNTLLFAAWRDTNCHCNQPTVPCDSYYDSVNFFENFISTKLSHKGCNDSLSEMMFLYSRKTLDNVKEVRNRKETKKSYSQRFLRNRFTIIDVHAHRFFFLLRLFMALAPVRPTSFSIRSHTPHNHQVASSHFLFYICSRHVRVTTKKVFRINCLHCCLFCAMSIIRFLWLVSATLRQLAATFYWTVFLTRLSPLTAHCISDLSPCRCSSSSSP